MTKLWEDLKDNMRDWSTSAVEKAEEMSRVALNKTEELTRISKIKFDIHQLQRQINKNYENLGHLVYSKTKIDHNASFSGNSEFFKIINDTDRLKKNITVKQNEINSIKVEFDIENEDTPISNDTDVDAKSKEDNGREKSESTL
tara:strand:- start:2165 stop:2596 length:432 start_codon:yes stop_codon:yes gene_type:complete